MDLRVDVSSSIPVGKIISFRLVSLHYSMCPLEPKLQWELFSLEFKIDILGNLVTAAGLEAPLSGGSWMAYNWMGTPFFMKEELLQMSCLSKDS